MSDIRQKIVKSLVKTPLTSREIAEDYKLKPQSVSATLQQMALSGFVERGDVDEIGVQIWKVTNLGITEYGTKEDAENALAQTEKTSSVEPEPAQIMAKSVLEQIVNNGLGKLADIKYADDSIARGMCSVKSVAEEISATGKENLPVNAKLETTEIPLKEMEIGTFEVFQLTDELASSFIKLMKSKQAKPIDNIDYKIATLESLTDICNTKISATLREIAADLRG